MFQSPSNRVKCSDRISLVTANRDGKQFQSPSNRVKCSDRAEEMAADLGGTEFQSPSNRVKCSDWLRCQAGGSATTGFNPLVIGSSVLMRNLFRQTLRHAGVSIP